MHTEQNQQHETHGIEIVLSIILLFMDTMPTKNPLNLLANSSEKTSNSLVPKLQEAWDYQD